MPCRCPIVLECCIYMQNDDLNYIAVFQQDKDFLSYENINSISALADFSRRPHSLEEISENNV